MLIKHLTSVNVLDVSTILSIFKRAHYFSKLIKSKKKIPKILQDKIIGNIFFEHSTRTKLSFEIAAKRLGAEVINFSPASSSLSKGETLLDTLRTFEALGIDIGIIRHADDNFIEDFSQNNPFCVINAGAGKKEHPTQSLLDLFTMQQEFGDLSGLKVLICGDILNSRVAKSNISALAKFGAEVYLSGPDDLLPDRSSLPNHCKILPLDEALKESQVAMFLRIQHERHHLTEINLEAYHEEFGLTQTREKLMPTNSIIMHPGPFNRDVEIASSLIDSEKSRIFKQKQNGVYTRMAILEWILS